MADEQTTAQVHPEKLTKALLEASKEAGTEVTIGTVQGITSDKEGRVTGEKSTTSRQNNISDVLQAEAWLDAASIHSMQRQTTISLH